VEKLIYLLFDDADRSGGELREAVIEKAVPAVREAGGEQVIVCVQDEDVAGGQHLRRSDPPIRAMVSFWLQTADDRGPGEEALGALVPRIAGYLVVESRPMIHEINVGGRTPGMNQVTCIARKPGMSDADFYGYWHTTHKQVAIDTQSTTGYVRNVIQRSITPDAPECWTAIVEETFPIGALTDPKIFYDAEDDAQLKANVDTMMESCHRFLDFEPMEVTHMSEYCLG
jgi:hypothetical protein